jgi:hypothetical protein
MNPLSTMQVMAPRADAPVISGSTDLVIVVLNELACAGAAAGACMFSSADHASLTSAA